MAEYINYWLKNIIKDTPNDMELGKKIREISRKEGNKDKYIYERNPDTGEIPLRTGLANALLDKNSKEKPDSKSADKKKLKMSGIKQEKMQLKLVLKYIMILNVFIVMVC